MELTTLEETTQPIFGRTHLTLQATFDASVPSRGVIAQRICEDRDVAMELLVIRTITPRFGGGVATVDAYVYEDAAKLAELEREHLIARTKKTVPEKKAEPQSVEEAVEEAAPKAEEAAEEPAPEKAD